MTKHSLDTSRQIAGRWIIEGDLVLQTPTHLGNGDSDGLVDMPLLLDEATGNTILTGTSLAGALRNYLRERRHGFGASPQDHLVESLFGADKGNDEGSQSALIVEDAVGGAPKIELRDGVRIDPKTRTAKIDFDGDTKRGYKYDLQLLEAGTTFPIRLELLLSTHADEPAPDKIKELLAVALHGLASGEIAIGLRKRRGFGECKVSQWRVTHYDLRQLAGLLAWLAADHPAWGYAGETHTGIGVEIAHLLNTSIDGHKDNRNLCRLQAKFMLDGSLLIRSGFGEQDQGPDTIHLHSYRAEAGVRSPVLPGTSLAGVLRRRAERILRTLGAAPTTSNQFLDEMFGPAEIKSAKRGKNTRSAWASRLLARETTIHNPQELAQNRIRIDRFTGGAYESALFNEQPLFGDDKTYVSVDLSLRDPKPGEIGLLLLLLKDLWTSDLPLGGESSIGRGRLQGVDASITLDDEVLGHLQAGAGGQVTIEGDRSVLENYVASVRKDLSK